MPQRDVIEKWVEALESGEYQQARGALHDVSGDEHSFCCLGVLCELAVEAGVIEPSVPRDNHVSWAYRTFDGSLEGAMLPDAVKQWAGLDYSPEIAYPFKDNPENMEPLSGVNDNFGWDFTRIAQAIRETYLESADAAA